MRAVVFGLPLGLFRNGVATVAAGGRHGCSRPSTRLELEVVHDLLDQNQPGSWLEAKHPAAGLAPVQS